MNTWNVWNGSSLIEVKADKLHVEHGALIFSAWRHTEVPGKPGVFFEDGGFFQAVRVFAPDTWQGCIEEQR